jgi:hypothetical protein
MASEASLACEEARRLLARPRIFARARVALCETAQDSLVSHHELLYAPDRATQLSQPEHERSA